MASLVGCNLSSLSESPFARHIVDQRESVGFQRFTTVWSRSFVGLDLFSGTGMIGLEFLSRGAKSVVSKPFQSKE